MLDTVDCEDRCLFRHGRRVQGELGKRLEVGCRVGQQEVFVAESGKPVRFRQGESHDAPEAFVPVEDPVDQSPAADRLAGDPDRLVPGTPEHGVGIGPHRIEVDEGKWSLDIFEDSF